MFAAGKLYLVLYPQCAWVIWIWIQTHGVKMEYGDDRLLHRNVAEQLEAPDRDGASALNRVMTQQKRPAVRERPPQEENVSGKRRRSGRKSIEFR